MIGDIIQVIISLILIIILAIIGYSIYNREMINALNTFNTVQKKTLILNGTIDFASTQNIIYDTNDSSKPSFIDLRPSVNQNGGAEYSYNFWLYRDSSKLSTVLTKDIGLILRGDKTKVHYNSNNCNVNTKAGSYILVKNPFIRMKSDGSSIVVEYNTLTNPDSYHNGGNDQLNCNSNWFEKNKGFLGIYDINSSYDKKWCMITIVIQEVTPDNDILYKNKTVCQLYLNGVLMMDKIVESPYNGGVEGSTAMRQNKGKLYIAPTNIFTPSRIGNPEDLISSSNTGAVMMSNVTYFNYSITSAMVESLFSEGFNDNPAALPGASTDQGLNKIGPAILKGNNMPKPF